MTIEINESKLPDKASDLILLALDDLEKAERSPDYEIDMGLWCAPDHEGVCHVCFAGAVMVGTLGLNSTDLFRAMEYGEFCPAFHKAFNFLDNIRDYDFACGGLIPESISASLVKFIDGLNEQSYQSNPNIWKSNMRAIAAWLKERGA